MGDAGEWIFSDKYYSYIDTQKSFNKDKILFDIDHIDGQNPLTEASLARQNFNNGVLKIIFHPDLTEYQTEVTACHEIHHHELIRLGYTSYYMLSEEYRSDSSWDGVYRQLQNLIHDKLIEDYLEKFGYDINGCLDIIYKTCKDKMSKASRHNDSLSVHLGRAIDVANIAIRFNKEGYKEKRSELLRLYRSKSPNEYQLGIKIYKIAKDIDYDKSESVTAAQIKILEILGIREKMYLQDWVTKEIICPLIKPEKTM